MSKGLDLSGKAALVSGAGGGICRAIAVAFAEAGAAVACADIDTTGAAETARLVQVAGQKAISLHCNVADEAEVNAATKAAHDGFGRLDILVSGAAPHDPGGPITETPLSEWQMVV
ncbi:MAG TPA: SDR family oxidoreductase, partial [Stellaceae bacterium]|nr:SDR family oxidoreductase [Stellaceae bacterium]